MMTRKSPEVTNHNLWFTEMPRDIEIQDRFIAQTGNVLDPNKMKFWSLPEYILRVPLGISV
jgi:hypothetical protein